MFKWFWKWIDSREYDPIIEGPMAHTYSDVLIRTRIMERYKTVYPLPVNTPLTHPWLFDPLDPPEGWAWDPFYEIWIKKDSY
jgi:hypothetical protein